MKKFSSLVMALAMVVSTALAGCSQSAKQEASTPTPTAKQEEAKPKTDYPKKPIELIIPSSAGGGTDTVSRIIVNAVNKHIPNGQSVVAVNKAGAAGTIANAEVFLAKPDGYKIGVVTTGGLAIQPNYGKTPYKATDFIPIAQFISVPNLLVVRSDAPWKTYEEWLDYVKKNPRKFKYSTAGTGNTQHLAMEALNNQEGIQTEHVPFEGSAPAMTALLGNHVDGTVVLVTEAKQHTDSGEFRVLANLGSAKTDVYKDAAFLKDTGYVGLDAWTGLVVPKDTSKEIVDMLTDVFKKAMEDPQVKDELAKLGVEPKYAGPQEFAKVIEDTANSTGEIIAKIGLKK